MSKSIFDKDFQINNRLIKYDIIIDLRYVIFNEKNLQSEEIYDEFFHYIKGLNKEILKTDKKFQYIVPLPCRDFYRYYKQLLSFKHITVLFTEYILFRETKLLSKTLRDFRYFDFPENIMSFLFKTLFHAKEKSGFYYAKSPDAVSADTIRENGQLINFTFTYNVMKNHQGSEDQLSQTKDIFQCTDYFNLYRIL